MTLGRWVFKVLLVALVFATWAFVSAGCVHGIAAPEEEWNRTFGGPSGAQAYSVQQTTDGGYIIAGSTWSYDSNFDFWLVKTDSNGTELWNRTFVGGPSDDEARAAQQTFDGGYIIAGYTWSNDNFNCWLVKTDSNGTELWNRTFGGSSDDKVQAVRQTTDGGYILAGETSSHLTSINPDFWLVKTDENGTELWNRTFGGPSSDEAYSVQQTSDGGYILAGYSFSYVLVKTDANGNKLWNRTFGGGGANSVQQTSDGGYIFAGSISDDAGFDFWLVKTDQNGTELWNRTFGVNTSVDVAYSVQKTTDGGYILAGVTSLYGDPDFWLVKTDENGDELWNRTFGGSSSMDWAKSVQQTSDGGYILAGSTYGCCPEYEDVWLIKLEAETNQAPVASFGYLPVNPGVNETITFNASTSYDPDGSIASYNWSFGDGNIANTTEAMITHSYASVGEYFVNLTVTDTEGATNRTSQTIKVFSNISYFDTEAGTYPSIPGTHNGTITMTRTVNVSRIYLYPCVGTGGHIEYARIWNASWDGAEARWDGYVGDWHNLSFDKNFTLVAGETYNYTIRTGSYPQIHHTPELLTAKGWITCTSFIDANGKQHENWIPAIRLS